MSQGWWYSSLKGVEQEIFYFSSCTHFTKALLLLLSRFSHVQLCVTPRRRPIRLPCPWNSPGENTGVGCHFLLQCVKVKSKSEVAQSCPTLSDPMDCSLPGSSVHVIFQQEDWSGVPSPSPLLKHKMPQYYRILRQFRNEKERSRQSLPHLSSDTIQLMLHLMLVPVSLCGQSWTFQGKVNKLSEGSKQQTDLTRPTQAAFAFKKYFS